MTVQVKPPLDEALLIHYGIKGMKWGQRKADDDEGSGLSTKQKVAIGATVAVGAAAAIYVLKQSGKTPKQDAFASKATKMGFRASAKILKTTAVQSAKVTGKAAKVTAKAGARTVPWAAKKIGTVTSRAAVNAATKAAVKVSAATAKGAVNVAKTYASTVNVGSKAIKLTTASGRLSLKMASEAARASQKKGRLAALASLDFIK